MAALLSLSAVAAATDQPSRATTGAGKAGLDPEMSAGDRKPHVSSSRHLFPSGPVQTQRLIQQASFQDEAASTAPVPAPDKSLSPKPVDPGTANADSKPAATVQIPMEPLKPTPGLSSHVYHQPIYTPHDCCRQQVPHRWLSVESLLWWTNGTDSPVIATTSPQGTPGLQAGVLGQPTTTPLYSGQDIFNLPQSGFRIRAGRSSECDSGQGIQGEFLMLFSGRETFSGASNGNPIIARPFTNALTGAADSQLLAYPGLSSGSLDFMASTRMYSGALWLWSEVERDCDGCGEGCGQEGCSCSGSRGDETLFGVKFGPRFAHLEDDIRFR
ncbi:MAG: BBP7 family outer membrane beta-barrel protein, partial [Planctomycetaceae bacterium]|nr:BBP7 family outer membrane beta-barrel protein [Planctomycetaceae bacterium]